MRWAVMAAVLAGCAAAPAGADGGADAGGCPAGYVWRLCGDGGACVAAPSTEWTASVTRLTGAIAGHAVDVALRGYTNRGARGVVGPSPRLPVALTGPLTGADLERVVVSLADTDPLAPPDATVACAGAIQVFNPFAPGLACADLPGGLLPGNPADGYGNGQLACGRYAVQLRFDRAR